MYQIESYSYIDKKQNHTILFLHGWGCDLTYMLSLTNNVDYANSLIIDLPGFGKNKPFEEPKTILDYVDIIVNFLNKNNYQIDIIVGHSFGGKLSTILCNKLKVKGLLLLAPSIYNSRRGIKYYFKVYLYKFIKKFKIFKKLLPLFGSKDYKSLNPIMKKTMSNVINSNVETDLKNIEVPIVVIFGKKDKITPKYLGKKIVKRAKDASLIMVEGNHFAYLYNVVLISRILESLVKSTCY